MNGVVAINLRCKPETSLATEMKFGMDHALSAGPIAQTVDLQSSLLSLSYGCPHLPFMDIQYIQYALIVRKVTVLCPLFTYFTFFLCSFRSFLHSQYAIFLPGYLWHKYSVVAFDQIFLVFSLVFPRGPIYLFPHREITRTKRAKHTVVSFDKICIFMYKDNIFSSIQTYHSCNHKTLWMYEAF